VSWLWRWLRRPREVKVDGSEAAAAEAVARQKLAEAQARRPETARAVNQFAAEVEAALARRRHR
jgi:hypothetical protein